MTVSRSQPSRLHPVLPLPLYKTPSTWLSVWVAVKISPNGKITRIPREISPNGKIKRHRKTSKISEKKIKPRTKKARMTMNLLETIINSIAAGDRAARKVDPDLPGNTPNPNALWQPDQRVPAWIRADDTATDLTKNGRHVGEFANGILPGFEGVESGKFANLFNDLKAGEESVLAGQKASKANPLKDGSRSALNDAIHAAIVGSLLSDYAGPTGKTD